MYNNKFVAVIKANGQILRENGDKVIIPFGTEYSILLKNLNTVRAKARVFVDGVDATGGRSLVIPAGGEVDFTRFLKSNNLNEGNRFKFIERTAPIEQYRGVGAEDGLIRIEYRFEKPNQSISHLLNGGIVSKDTFNINNIQGGIGDSNNRYYGRLLERTNGSPQLLSAHNISCSAQSFVKTANTQFLGSAEAMVQNDVGITVPGSISTQRFEEAIDFTTENETNTIILRLVGQIDNNLVQTPITVTTKPKCETCGRVNQATALFCSQCGTSLQRV